MQASAFVPRRRTPAPPSIIGKFGDLWAVAIILAVSLVAMRELILNTGYFINHDGPAHLARVYALSYELDRGQFPVRWGSTLLNTYGYALFNFMYPLPYYLAMPVYELTHSSGAALRSVFVFATAASGIGMYLWGRTVWGRLGGLLAAMFYVLAPYHFVDTIVRGAVGESLAFAWVPLVFWAAEKALSDGRLRWVVIGGVAYALLMLSHNITALLVTPVVAAYIGIISLDRMDFRGLFRSLGGIALGMALAAFYWLPALVELQYVRGFEGWREFWSAHFVTLRQLVLPSWSYEPSVVGDLYPFEMPFQIGPIHLFLLIVVGLAAIFRMRSRENQLRVAFLLLMTVALGYLMTDRSWVIWRLLSILPNIQFPWRFLTVINLLTAFAVGAVPMLMPQWRRATVVVLGAALVITTWGYAIPRAITQEQQIITVQADGESAPGVSKNNVYYGSADYTSDYYPKWAPAVSPDKVPAQKMEVLQGAATLEDVRLAPLTYTLRVVADGPARVRINTFYFPGWEIAVDGKPSPIIYEENGGLMDFDVTPGTHDVVAHFGDTPLRKASSWVSLFTAGALVLFAFAFLVRATAARLSSLRPPLGSARR